MDIIKIDNLTKKFGNVLAVDNLSFKVKKGELFAFLGQNGAGKSTTINIICSRLKKDSGRVEIDGEEILENSFLAKAKLGVVFQSSVLDKPMTVLDNLKSRAALYGIKDKDFEERLNELSNLFDLASFLNRPVGKLSGGQRRKVDIVRALIHKPKIFILDEPTTGLDPMSRKTMWDVITTLRKTENITVFLTTHYMEEAAEADYIVILDKGKICAEGSPIELKNTYAEDYLYLYDVLEENVARLNIPYEKVVDGYKIAVKDTAIISELIVKNKELFKDFEVVKGKMDDVFLAVTGRKLDGGEEK